MFRLIVYFSNLDSVSHYSNRHVPADYSECSRVHQTRVLLSHVIITSHKYIFQAQTSGHRVRPLKYMNGSNEWVSPELMLNKVMLVLLAVL